MLNGSVFRRISRMAVLALLLVVLLNVGQPMASASSAGGLSSASSSGPYVPATMQYLAIASSEYQLKYNTEYTVGASMAVDGNLETAWNEGAPGTGVGEWIRLIPADGGRYTYQGFKIANGFQYHDYWKGDRWVKNNRVKYLLVYNDMGEPVGSHLIEDVYNGYQYIYFDEPVTSDYLQFEIMAVWEGKDFSEACISEIVPF